jgi:transcriptional regulator with XRE-family HTH domain
LITPDRIKRIRFENKLSQQELADKLDVSKQYISDLEREIKPISKKFVDKIKQAGLLIDYDTEVKKAFASIDDETIKEFIQVYSKALDLDIDAINKLEQELKTLRKVAERVKKDA